MRTLNDLSIGKGMRVLLRCDLNVPMERGLIVDDFRIGESVPTIRLLSEKGAKCIVLAHLGRPDPIWGIRAPKSKSNTQSEFTLQPIAKRLGELIGKEVKFMSEPIGKKVHDGIEAMGPGEVAMLENIRFYKGEEENDLVFAKELAQLGDLYINDAFGVCHRAHASIVRVPRLLPAVAGLLLEKEAKVLSKIREKPVRPMVVVVGGTKVETKGAFLAHISTNADSILLGNLISRQAKEKGIRLAHTTEVVYALDAIPGDGEELDIGPRTIELFLTKLKGARTIFWAGPLGKIEQEPYEQGSLIIAKAIVNSGAFTVAGGGDLGAFLNKHHLRERFDHVSTGGGAMLAFLAGDALAGIQALEQSL